MTFRFEPTILPGSMEIRLFGPKGIIATDRWSTAVPHALIPSVDLAQQLAGEDDAALEVDVLRLEHQTAASLTPRQASSLGLPARADVVAQLKMRGTLGKPGYGADLTWKRITGANVIVGERLGAFLKIGREWQRLPRELYDVAERVDQLNAAAPEMGAQLAGVAALREVLPIAEETGTAETKGVIGKMTIAVADAFSLDLKGEGDKTKLVPILHRAGAVTDAPMLPPDKQAAFGEDQFHKFGEGRAFYAVGGDTYVVLCEPLQKALTVVHRCQNRSAKLRKSLFVNPRAYLRSALGEELDDILLEGLVRDTPAYSDRVIGLGLWSPRIVPWIKLPSTDWVGDGGGTAGARPPTEGGITIGEQQIPLTAPETIALQAQIEEAITAGQPVIPHAHKGETHFIPATPEVLEAVKTVAKELARATSHPPVQRVEQVPGEPGREVKALTTRETVIIRPNEETVEFEGRLSPRPAPAFGVPRALATCLKPHQHEGLDWLQKSWAFGSPGVLLADDMGLGKTIQGLAFMAWLREGMFAGRIPKKPILIVAPTGLLHNWRAEHDRHLQGAGLGICTEAFGAELKALKREAADGRPGLDPQRLEQADWVLTTYETLRDYIADFGAVRFAALMFDEAQKIKNPGVRLTDAAKSANADFIIALTGTPVENRLADLWCITDAVHPAFLGDLKTFSRTYEDQPDTGQTRELRSHLDSWRGARPPIMLRRMKRDKLPDLPVEHECLQPAPMPAPQFAAYSSAIVEARGAQGPGVMLKALQALRRISLHPDVAFDGSDAAFIAGSARLTKAFEVLDRIEAAQERALIFLEEREMQARLIGLIQRRYRLEQPPMLINGEVAGGTRQQRVDRFQVGPNGFDVMILSPKAGGVGLTLTRANHVIHLSRWWNPAVEDQCTGRALRIGQTRPVSIYIPMATLADGRKSFDENLHALLERKRQLSQEALLPSERPSEDTAELFRETVEPK
jgi:hypothetical protein